jgi:hypothetical protein
MAFPSITSFKEQLIDGGARASLFEMRLTFPLGVAAIAGPQVGAAMSAARFRCRMSEIPGNQMTPVIIKYAGREIKYSGQRMFNNLIVTIINDEGFTVRRALDAWMEAMNTRESNLAQLPDATGIGGYGGVGNVLQYNKQGKIVRTFSFVDMFPVTVAPIPLDWSNDAMVEEYTCEFAYQYWVPGGEDAFLDPQGRLSPTIQAGLLNTVL